MATYSVYDNILVQIESVFLKVEKEVDGEIAELLAQHQDIAAEITDLKCKVEMLNSLKKISEQYDDDSEELHNLTRTLLRSISDKQILLRFAQEKELLLNGYLVPTPDMKVPTVIELNKEFKLRKRMQEIELLSGFLLEDPDFAQYVSELQSVNDVYDFALESGASDRLEETIQIFENYFEKVLNIYSLNPDFLQQFKDFRSNIRQQESCVPPFTANDAFSVHTLQSAFKKVQMERINIEQEVEWLMYQFTMLQNGKKIILAEIKSTSGELESLIFKEYAVKQKIQELRQYKSELNAQKDSFMHDPTVDGYSEAVKQLEFVENRFRRLVIHKSHDKEALASRFFAANITKQEKRFFKEEQTTYNKILFLTLHNDHISSADKQVIYRLSKPSKLINSNAGKFFYTRPHGHALESTAEGVQKFQLEELH